jgi:hypothetical protein
MSFPGMAVVSTYVPHVWGRSYWRTTTKLLISLDSEAKSDVLCVHHPLLSFPGRLLSAVVKGLTVTGPIVLATEWPVTQAVLSELICRF